MKHNYLNNRDILKERSAFEEGFDEDVGEGHGHWSWKWMEIS